MPPSVARKKTDASKARTDFLVATREEILAARDLATLQHELILDDLRHETHVALARMAMESQKITGLLDLYVARNTFATLAPMMADLKITEAQIKLEQARANLDLISLALAERLDLSTYLDIKKKLAYQRVDFSAAIGEIEFATFADDSFDLYRRDRILQKQLDEIYTELYLIERDTNIPEDLRARKRIDRENTVDALLKDKRNIEREISQANNRQKPRRTNSKANSPRDARRPYQAD